MYQYTSTVHTPVFLLLVPKFILYFSDSNFACLTAEDISDLVSNQDRR
jgi:hypothetical protein